MVDSSLFWRVVECTIVPKTIETCRVNVLERVVEDVGVAVPGLGVGGVDGGEAGGVWGGPAALDAVFAGGEVVEAGDGVLALGGEGGVEGAPSTTLRAGSGSWGKIRRFEGWKV